MCISDGNYYIASRGSCANGLKCKKVHLNILNLSKFASRVFFLPVEGMPQFSIILELYQNFLLLRHWYAVARFLLSYSKGIV